MGIEKRQQVARCAEHGEYTADVIEINGKQHVQPCPQCLEAKQTAQDGHRRAKKAGKVVGLPKRFWAANFDGYQAEGPEQGKVKRFSRAYAEKESVMERGVKMLFCGKPGTGKTHLAAAIIRAMAERGVNCRYSHVYQIMSEIKATYDGPGVEKEVKQRYITAPFLVIDEIGVQKGSDFERNVLFEIINERHNELRPTLLVSNLGVSALTEYLGEPFIDRFYEDGGQVMTFTWGSYRKKQKKS